MDCDNNPPQPPLRYFRHRIIHADSAAAAAEQPALINTRRVIDYPTARAHRYTRTYEHRPQVSRINFYSLVSSI